MKAQVLTSKNNLVWEDRDKPVPEKGEVLVKIKSTGVCSSDKSRVFNGEVYHFPIVLGHEFSGIIESVGKGVDDKYLNQRCVVFPLKPCFSCPSCAVSEFARCDSYSYFGSREDGAFQEYLSVPLWNIVTFPESLSYQEAAMCEPAAVALHSINASIVHPGDNILVIGSGSIGIILAIWAKSMNLNTYIACSSKEKEAFLQQFGFTGVINTQDLEIDKYFNDKNIEIDVSFECVGSSSSIEKVLYSTKKGGQVILTGNPDGDIIVHKDAYWKILRKELSVKGIWNSHFGVDKNEWDIVLKAMNNGSLNVKSLITQQYPLEKLEDAFNTIKKKDEFIIKVMINNEK